jgi:hypothetical protein
MFFFGNIIYGTQRFVAPARTPAKAPRSLSKTTSHPVAVEADRTISPVACLLINAVAILSEDRFLARSTWLSPGQIPTPPNSSKPSLACARDSEDASR